MRLTEANLRDWAAQAGLLSGGKRRGGRPPLTREFLAQVADWAREASRMETSYYSYIAERVNKHYDWEPRPETIKVWIKRAKTRTTFSAVTPSAATNSAGHAALAQAHERTADMASITKYPTAKGDRWRVQYRTPENRVTQRRGFTTKRAAEDVAASVHMSKLRGEYIDPSDAPVTVGDLGPAWLARRTHLKPSTRRSEEIAWRVHVEPRWGTVKLADIKHSSVQSWVSQMGREVTDAAGTVTKRASGATVVIRAFGVLAAILDEAVADRRLMTNRSRGQVAAQGQA